MEFLAEKKIRNFARWSILVGAVILVILATNLLAIEHQDTEYFSNNTNNDYIEVVLRRYKRQAVNNGENCEIPLKPSFTQHTILGQSETSYKPDDLVKQYSILEISCNKGYALSPFASKTLICKNGKWDNQPTACLSTCPSLISTETTTVSCSYNNLPLKDCINPVKETIAMLSCNPLYEEPHIQKNPIRVCRENRWDPFISHCSPICGVKHPQGVPNIVNGKAITIGDYPWQVALYYSSNHEILCGGSIIDQNIILTAAHCITDYNGKIQPASNYLVAAGKYFRKYDHDGDYLAQYSNISAIHVPERYAGSINMFALDIAILILSNPFTLTEAVQPVCIELNEASSYLTLSPYDEGIVTGWGYTQEGGVLSDVLKELIIPYIPYRTCFDELPSNFRRYFTQDKICGGYRNNASSICRGDSGGALVFKRFSSDRYFVQGIVSTSPATIGGTCDSNQYSLYTNVNNHIRFMQYVVARNQFRKPLECVSDDCANEQNNEQRNVLTKGKNCTLPNFPLNGKYILNENDTYEPGNYVKSNNLLSLKCDFGFVSGNMSQSYCSDTGEWIPPVMGCSSSKFDLAEGDDCLTPTNEKAYCIKVRSCEVIVKELKSNSIESIRFAQKSQCGFSTEPLVCCGSSGLPTLNIYQHELLPTPDECGLETLSVNHNDAIRHNGKETEIKQYPWTAMLGYISTDFVYYNSDNISVDYLCTGSLINKRFVLTSAICTQGLVGIKVRLGAHNSATSIDCKSLQILQVCNPAVQDYLTHSIINHPGYSRRYKKDSIGLIRLRGIVEYNVHIQPICLPAESAPLMVGTNLTIVGLKSPEKGSGKFSKVNLFVLSQTKCEEELSKIFNISDKQYCTLQICEKNQCPCVPYQGLYIRAMQHPTQFQWIQVGISSLGISGCHPNFPEVHTRISKYVNWIVDNIRL